MFYYKGNKIDLNDIKTSIINIKDNNIYITQEEKTSDFDYSTVLQEAINEAVANNKKIVFNAGVYKISNTINCPEGCTIEIEGSSDAFANSMNRTSRTTNGVNFWYENLANETMLLYTGADSLFSTPGGDSKEVMFKFSKLSFRNASSIESEYLFSGRVVGQLIKKSSSKGKVYAENCLFSGFKVCFGDSYVTEALEDALNTLDGRVKMTKPEGALEKCSFVGTRCRFVACGSAVNLGVDSRLIDCSFNNGWYGLTFQENSGISTISNCRLEWLKLNGIYSNDCHDITVIGNEFDRIGHAGVYFTNNTKPNITSNIFRRCGSDTNYDYTAITKDVQLYIDSCEGGVVSSNVTIKKAITDDGGAVRPSNSICIRNNNALIVTSNDFTGCTTGTNNKIDNNINSIINNNIITKANVYIDGNIYIENIEN